MKIPIFAFALTGLATGAVAQELPSTEELVSRVGVPGFWEVEEFRTIAKAMVGTPIEPRAQIRFEIDASPRADLFLPSGTENLGPFLTVIASTPDETTRTIYGTMDLTYSAGQWTGPINVENPVDGLGQPKDAFTVPTLILGSDTQKKVAKDLLGAAAAEIRIALERDRQRLLEQQASEIEAMKASYLAELSVLRQNQEASRIRLEEMKNRVEGEIEGLEARITDRFNRGEAVLKEKLAVAETGLQAEIDALTGAHQVKLRELKVSQSKQIGATVADHLEELQKLNTEHAKAVGTLIAEQEREMAEVTSKLETRNSGLEAQLVAADEVLALQASLTARQTAIRVNDESIKAAEQERQVQFGTSLDGLLGNWTGTVICKTRKAPDGQLLTISFLGENVVGRSITGQVKNPTWGSNYNSVVQLHLSGNDLTLPLSLKATLNDSSAILTKSLDLTLQADGWMVGQSPDGVCTEVRLAKS